jgi:NTE family protein
MRMDFATTRVGLALSGGGVRGLAHIGVIKALSELGIQPAVIAGTSAGSLVGAGLAAGMDWQELRAMAHAVFWPTLLNGKLLERFCEQQLPATFEQLRYPFAAVTTEFPARRPVILTEGRLASAISASCALRIIRRPVRRAGLKLKDGGYTCVLPAKACRDLGAELVISSDVWELSSLLRAFGCKPEHPLFPQHYREAVQKTDWLIQPAIPFSSYVPNVTSIERLIAAGERATLHTLKARALIQPA